MLTDYQDLVDDLVRDDTGKVTAADRDVAIGLALSRYSQDRPDRKVEDLTGDGTAFLALPAGWQSDFSTLQSLEYPLGNNPPSLVAAGKWRLYDTPAGRQIMLASTVPTGAAVRATFTVRRQLDDAADTIPVDHREPVASYAAALVLDELASLFSGDSDSTIQADAVAHVTKGQEYAARARALRKRYFDVLGASEGRLAPASGVVDLDLADSRRQDRLQHLGRLR